MNKRHLSEEDSETEEPKYNNKTTKRKKTEKPITARQISLIIIKLLKNQDTKKEEEINMDDFNKELTAWGPIELLHDECEKDLFMNDQTNAREFSIKLADQNNKNQWIPVDNFLPNPDCNQIVLGLNKDLAQYFIHNFDDKDIRENKGTNEYGNFILLSTSDWTDELNKHYLSCAITNNFNNTCGLPIRILIPKDASDLKKTKDGKVTPKVTAKELMFLYETLYILNNERGIQHQWIDTGDEFTYNILLLYPSQSNGGKSKKKHKNRTRKLRNKKKKTLKKRTRK